MDLTQFNEFAQGFFKVIPYYIIGVYSVSSIDKLFRCTSHKNIILKHINTISRENIRNAIIRIASDEELASQLVKFTNGVSCAQKGITYRMIDDISGIVAHTCDNSMDIPISLNSSSVDEIFEIISSIITK